MSDIDDQPPEDVKRATVTDSSRDRAGQTSEPKPQRDFWDYAEILARPLAATLTALAIALIGLMGNNALKQQQDHQLAMARQGAEEENRRAADAQDHRLFTDLVSKREDAETALRKDMFNTILKDFFHPDSDDGALDIPNRLLKLEMLALNFGESLSLTPLFIELDKDIHEERGGDGFLSEIDWLDQRDRLHGLARRVSGRQISALAPSGKIFEFDVAVQQTSDLDRFRWPDDAIASNSDASPSDAALIALSDIEFDGIKRTYSAEFSSADRERKTVRVDIEIQTWDPETDLPLTDVVEMGFELNFFNFPMVDNTRLSSDQRFGLIMERFDELNIHVVGVIFRGMYSSSRDKPFLDDVINQLRRKPPLNGSSPGSESPGDSPKEPVGEI